MATSPAVNSAKKQPSGKPFAKGQSGNPKGKPVGTRNKTAAILDALLADGATAVAKALVNAAKGGDIATAKWLLDRLAPARKDAPIVFELPSIGDDPAELVRASASIIAAVASGTITPGEGAAMQSLLDRHRAMIETSDLAARVIDLKKRYENN